MLRFARFSLFVLSLLLVATSCDFNAAEDAVNDFDVLIGLPSLSTVVNVQALDASTGQPVSQEVTVTFDGENAGSVMDIYNDPIAELAIQDGFGTFALDPASGPTPTNPAQVTLRVQSERYNATTTTIQATQDGSVNRVIRLTPEDPRKEAAGTAGVREGVSTNDNGETTRPVSGGTDKAKAAEAQGTFEIPQGIRLATASGDPVQGPVTVDLSVFDNSPAAQELLPSEVKVNENGQLRQIQGGVRFTVRGANGRLASQFGISAEPDTATATIDFPTLSTSGTPTITLVDAETGATRTVSLTSSSGSSKRGGAASQSGETKFLFVQNSIVVRSPSGTTTIDRGEFGGKLFAVAGAEPSSTCSPGALTINPNGQSGSMRVQISGDGFAVSRTVGIPDSESSFTLSSSSLFEGEIPDLGNVTLSVRTVDDQTSTTTIDPCSESSITLEAPATNRIDATVKAEANCPAGERLPISPPFDGYSLAYRLKGSTSPYWTVPRSAISFNTTDDAKETVTSVVVSVSGVRPGADYNAVGTFGSRTATLADAGRDAITMPSQDGGQVTITDEELREECQ